MFLNILLSITQIEKGKMFSRWKDARQNREYIPPKSHYPRVCLSPISSTINNNSSSKKFARKTVKSLNNHFLIFELCCWQIEKTSSAWDNFLGKTKLKKYDENRYNGYKNDRQKFKIVQEKSWVKKINLFTELFVWIDYRNESTNYIITLDNYLFCQNDVYVFD